MKQKYLKIYFFKNSKFFSDNACTSVRCYKSMTNTCVFGLIQAFAYVINYFYVIFNMRKYKHLVCDDNVNFLKPILLHFSTNRNKLFKILYFRVSKRTYLLVVRAYFITCTFIVIRLRAWQKQWYNIVIEKLSLIHNFRIVFHELPITFRNFFKSWKNVWNYILKNTIFMYLISDRLMYP